MSKLLKSDKILGCIVGGAIGDCLGLPYEGQQQPKITAQQAWNISDDTQMTLATCEAISISGQVDPSQIASTFAEWFCAKRFTSLGASSYKALLELSQGGHWALVGRRGEMAAGNGAAMRIAPLAFCLDPDKESSKVLIRDICRITHHNEEAYIGALAIVIAIRAAYQNNWSGDFILVEYVANKLPDSSVRDRLIEASQLDKNTSILTIAQKFGCSGYVVETVPLVLYASQHVYSLGFETVLTQLIEAGGDTDTNASIAGQILGTLLGYNFLPQNWIDLLPNLNLITEMSKKFNNHIGCL